MINELDERARGIFRAIVDEYLATGAPVGSRTAAGRLAEALSPASVRSVMADLEELGLLYSPHTSAGRLPTDLGLRLFVDGILEVGAVGADERAAIEAQCHASGRSLSEALSEATATLSGLSACAGLVVAPKAEGRALRHLEFVVLSPGRVLVVLVTDDGQVENRVIEVPQGVPAASLVTASNFLSARLVGRTLAEARGVIEKELLARRGELDELTQRVIEAGVAVWAGGNAGQLIVRGQSQLLNNVQAGADLERIRSLFAALETYETMGKLLEATGQAEGVRIFIGAENALFNHAGCSLVIAPLRGLGERVVGAIGVIGPARLNYARVVPMVDYTAKVLGRAVG